MNCPGEEALVCYIDGLLPAEILRQVEEHLWGCDRYREIVDVTRNVMALDCSDFMWSYGPGEATEKT